MSLMSPAGQSSAGADEWVALVSGLEVGAANAAEGQVQLLAEYLAGEVGGLGDQSQSARISRLIIAGNSLGPIQASASTSTAEPERKSVGPHYPQCITVADNARSANMVTIRPSHPIRRKISLRT